MLEIPFNWDCEKISWVRGRIASRMICENAKSIEDSEI